MLLTSAQMGTYLGGKSFGRASGVSLRGSTKSSGVCVLILTFNLSNLSLLIVGGGDSFSGVFLLVSCNDGF